MTIYYDDDTFDRNGRTFRVRFPFDDDSDPPWKRSDGHGPISEWRFNHYGWARKAPGERVLVRDRGSCRFYDFAGAIKLAHKDGWGLCEEDLDALRRKLGREPTRKQIVAEAVERDFDYLRRWCDDQWHYIGVVVEAIDDEGEVIDSESIWGIESEEFAYLVEVAHELADEIAHRLDAEASERTRWAERDVVTIDSASKCACF